MKRFLAVLGTLDVAWVLVSLGGVVLDELRIEFWTWNLMAALLTSVVLAPLLVFSRSRSQPASSSDPDSGSNSSPASSPAGPRSSRSMAQTLIYTVTGLLFAWMFASFFGLFLDPGNLSFWTQSVMWTLIAAVVWAPVLVFGINPLDEPAVFESSLSAGAPADGTAADGTATDDPADVEPFVPPSAYPLPSRTETRSAPMASAPVASAPVVTASDESGDEADRSESGSSHSDHSKTPDAADASSGTDFPIPPLASRSLPPLDPNWDPWPEDE